MDGVYDQNGRLNQAHTDFLISNDYVLKNAQAHPREFLAGVSINPKRRDAVEEVHRCADAGATLVKVLPNVQQFNPADPHDKSFYRTLTLRKLPFLDYPLSVFHVAAWGLVAFGALRDIIRTKNRFDRQVVG